MDMIKCPSHMTYLQDPDYHDTHDTTTHVCNKYPCIPPYSQFMYLLAYLFGLQVTTLQRAHALTHTHTHTHKRLVQ